MSQFAAIASTAANIIRIVGPMIEVALPGSEPAKKIAQALDVAGDYLRFGQQLEQKHLANVAADLEAIRKDVEAMAEAGTSVPQDKWDAVGKKIEGASARIRNAMGL